MKAYRSRFIIGCLISLGLFAMLPAVNWLFSSGSVSLTDPQGLFSLDLAHSHINRFLYRQEISANPRQVVVGRNGWLFPGNRFNRVSDKTRGLAGSQTSSASVKASIGELQDRQRWLAGRGIMTLFVIAPNKHSIYSEFLPADKHSEKHSFTDDFVARARTVGLNVLDLRALLLKTKKVTSPVYFKTDSHWNHYGAYLGYRDALAVLNEQYGARMKTVGPINWRWVLRGGGDLARLLKIDVLLGKDIDRDAEPSFAGSGASLCVQKLSVEKLASQGVCEMTANRRVQVDHHPQASFNPGALNRMNVLWLRDSFGDFNSELYQQTFSRLWEVHYKHFAKMDWRAVVEKVHPDLVIYQVAERAIHEPAFQSVAKTSK